MFIIIYCTYNVAFTASISINSDRIKNSVAIRKLGRKVY